MDIFIADGSRTIRDNTAAWLRIRKHRVEVVADASKLFELLAKSTPDAIFLEAGFDRMASSDLIRRVRTTAPRGQTYLIAMLSREPDEAIPVLLNLGADDFVRKPCSEQELIARVETPKRLAAWSAGIAPPSTPLDWSAGDATPQPALRHAGALMSDAIGRMLGARVERIALSSRALSQPAFGATVALTGFGQSSELEVGLAVGSGALRELIRRLIGDSDVTSAELEDFVREMANTAAGALKSAAQHDGMRLTTALPVSVPMITLAKLQRDGADAFTYRLSDTEHCFSLFVSARAKLVRSIATTALREGMVLFKDLHNDNGQLLLSAGTRITSTSAERIARFGGAKHVEISLPNPLANTSNRRRTSPTLPGVALKHG